MVNAKLAPNPLPGKLGSGAGEANRKRGRLASQNMGKQWLMALGRRVDHEVQPYRVLVRGIIGFADGVTAARG